MRLKTSLIICFLWITSASFGQNGYMDLVPIKIQWVNNLSGDFSFKEKWSYPFGVEMKADGRAGCADGGFCPERCYGMLDENGVVLKDSAAIFYQLLDTTHEFHTIKSETNAYEFDGTNFIEAILSGRTVMCYSRNGIATHSSLVLEINGDFCKSMIDFNSIKPEESELFYCTQGTIFIDKKLWKKGTLKAEFSLFFDDPGSSEPIYWKGLIYTKIATKIGI